MFNGQNSLQYSKTSIREILKNGINKLGINKNIVVHSLRHSYATHLYEQYKNLQLVADMLGHKSTKSTVRYKHMSVEFIKTIQIIDEIAA